ncbi:alpha/beta hydrolase domain-containing protein [Subtercola sp. YIM 133946]|uniref:alpha/beta hydrolase domain-containing protein n=1 Tax=Subtercola sp. YIM 133946 TaxID=3118909 RepID=UPI002F92724E
MALSVQIEGPIRGPGHVMGGYAGDLTIFGYVEEEYFVSGLARTYRPAGRLDVSGEWSVEATDTRPFRTRVIVHRPIDPSRFNGIVLCEWSNVSSLNEISWAVNENFHRSGYVYAAVSAQTVGVDGLDGVERSGLRRLDPQRYGRLKIPGDSCSFDIFAAVARCLMATHGVGARLLPGLSPHDCVAIGESQSASRLVSYVNAVHRHHQVFSAFILSVLLGGATDFDDSPVVPGQSKSDFNEQQLRRLIATTVRADAGVPVLLLQSETEARAARVPSPGDSEWIRVWELAGSVHRSACDGGYRPDISERDGWDDPFAGQAQRMVRFSPTIAAAARPLAQWAGGGRPLASQPRLRRRGQGVELELDDVGNVVGGVRMPEIEVPTAVYSSAVSLMWGDRTPLPRESLLGRYQDPTAYVERVREAATARAHVDQLLPWHVEQYVDEAVRLVNQRFSSGIN